MLQKLEDPLDKLDVYMTERDYDKAVDLIQASPSALPAACAMVEASTCAMVEASHRQRNVIARSPTAGFF